MKKRDLRQSFISIFYRREYIPVIILLCVSILVGSFLTTIPSQSAVAEHMTAAQSQSIRLIFDNPLNAPYKFASYLLLTLSPSVRMVRAVSFIFFVAASVSVFYALKHWHTLRASLLASLAFTTNAVMLGTARLGTPLITAVSFYVFASFLLWQLHTRSNKAVPIVVFVALSALLYTPGVFWFLLILSIVYWKNIKKLFMNVKRQALLVGMLCALIIMFPLLFSFVRDARQLADWLLLPTSVDWNTIPRSILRVPSAFIYRMPVESLINVSRLPVFDLASGFLFLIGLHAYRKNLRLDRVRVMIGSALAGIIIGAFGQVLVAIVMLIPFAFSVIAAGIEYLLDQWNSVFPRNPYAKSFGFIMVTTVILFGSYYQLSRFLVVWPQTPQTREIYDQPRIIHGALRTDTMIIIKMGDTRT